MAKDGEAIAINITDMLAFLYSEDSDKYTGILATQIMPSEDNPDGFNDNMREIIGQILRTIEPQ